MISALSIERMWLTSETTEEAEEAVRMMIMHPSLRWKVYLDWLASGNNGTGLHLSEVHKQALQAHETEIYEAIADLLINDGN